MSSQITPPVEMLKAFARDEALKGAAMLSYPDLEMRAQEALDKDGRIFNEFSDCEIGTVEEEDRARAAARGYFVLTGLQLQHAIPERRELVSERFTEASKELYGEPEADEVARLATHELEELGSYVDNPEVDQARLARVKRFYETQLEGVSVEARVTDERLVEALDAVAAMVEARFGSALQVFDEVEARGEKVSPEKVAELFQEGLDRLAELDPAWKNWCAKISESRAMKADVENRVIRVGGISREADRLRQLFGHEVLVHGMRAVNGAKTGDYMAENGLPDYLTAEEGLAKFVQIALSGERAAPASDIYMNIGFALGQLGKPPVTRQELQQIHLDKMIVKAQAEGKDVEVEDLTSKSWSDINRVYRGSLGNDVVAVNTKDITYHQGFLKIAKFIEGELQAGRSADEMFDYLASAKFDPTNPRHVAYLKGLQERK